MALLLTEDQTLLRDSASGFLKQNAPIAQFRELRDRNDPDGFSRPLWHGFAEMGFCGILIPETFGGLALGPVEAGIIMEEIGRTLAPSPFIGTALLAATALVRGGTPAQQQAWLPRLAQGTLIATLAVDEGPKHAPERTALVARRAGNGFALSGTKTFVADGHVADLLIVAARTGGSPGERAGLTLFLVDPRAQGVRIERTIMVDSHNAARLTFEDVAVDADAVLGTVDGGWALLEGVLDIGRAALAAEMTGLGEEAFGRTAQYLKERRQFGRVIAEFQALQHRIAHLWTELEITRAAVLKALQALAEDPATAGTLVSVAKARAGATATLAVQEAVQMHGGVGMTDAFDIGFFMKRARVTQEMFGDAYFHADRLARATGY